MKASSLISLSVAVAVCAVAFGGDLELQPIPGVAPRPSVPLKFLTFNIWGDYFNNPVGEREAGVETSILKVRPDVVSLQEVTPNWGGGGGRVRAY